jgi:hypothetical protein
MTTLYIGAAGTLLFLIPAILSFANKRFKTFVSFWKYPFFILPLVVFAWILSTQLYIPFKGNGCTYATNQSLIRPEKFSNHKKSGILMLFIDGFGDCQVSVTMKNGKIYAGNSLNNVFAIVLPSGYGQINNIQLDGRKYDIPGKMDFTINPGKLIYIGTIARSKDFLSFLPDMACKTADFTYKAPTATHLSLLKNWSNSNQLMLTPSIKDKLTKLQDNYIAASQFNGLQIGYLPFISVSLKGKTQDMTPNEIIKDYKDYEFLLKTTK